MENILNIVVPMAGKGTAFKNAGYSFPKPLIDVNGKTMIEVVVNNLKPDCPHRFIFICQKDQYEQYDLYHILQNATQNKFEVVTMSGDTQGAACTVLLATQYINTGDDFVIANADQYIDSDINQFIAAARGGDADGRIMTFDASHPRFSYARADQDGRVVEVAEKRVISRNATVGVYYFRHGSDFVSAAQSMIRKNIRHNNEFYVCPVYNEMILADKNVCIHPIPKESMHSMGTPEDLHAFVDFLHASPRPL